MVATVIFSSMVTGDPCGALPVDTMVAVAGAVLPPRVDPAQVKGVDEPLA